MDYTYVYIIIQLKLVINRIVQLRYVDGSVTVIWFLRIIKLV